MSTLCGTYAGYRYHENHKETSCEDCRIAYNAYKRQWRLDNPTKVKEYRDKHYAAHPDRAIERAAKRRRMKQQAVREKYSIEDVLGTYGTDCYICNTPIDLAAPRYQKYENWQLGLQIDHVIPISKGGEDTLKNVRPAHGICNIRKHHSVKQGSSS